MVSPTAPRAAALLFCAPVAVLRGGRGPRGPPVAGRLCRRAPALPPPRGSRVGGADPSRRRPRRLPLVASAGAPPPSSPGGADASAGAPPPPADNIGAYNAWIAAAQADRNAAASTSSSRAAAAALGTDSDGADAGGGGGGWALPRTAPPFPHPSLFHDGAEEYAMAATTPPSAAYVGIARATAAAGLFAPCMVGGLEGRFLTFLAAMSRASRVLDIGTFTGYSALAFADGVVGDDATVVTIEADDAAADVAAAAFAAAPAGHKVRLLRGDARAAVAAMVAAGEVYDLVFLDADKGNYWAYYEAGLAMLAEGGTLMADNALCSLLYAPDDPIRASLHDFVRRVAADPRVEQVMLPVREGILLVRKVRAPGG